MSASALVGRGGRTIGPAGTVSSGHEAAVAGRAPSADAADGVDAVRVPAVPDPGRDAGPAGQRGWPPGSHGPGSRGRAGGRDAHNAWAARTVTCTGRTRDRRTRGALPVLFHRWVRPRTGPAAGYPRAATRGSGSDPAVCAGAVADGAPRGSPGSTACPSPVTFRRAGQFRSRSGPHHRLTLAGAQCPCVWRCPL